MAARELRRCEAHGLAYDPNIHHGCTLCRGSARPTASSWKPDAVVSSEPEGALWILKTSAMVVIMAAWVCGITFGAFKAYEQAQSVSERMRAAAEANGPGGALEPLPLPGAPVARVVQQPVELAPVPTSLPLLERPGVDRYGYPLTTVDRLGLRALLVAGKYAELTAYIEQVQQAFQADFRKEEWVTAAVDAFDTADPEVGRYIEEWLAASPGSYAPVLARAQHGIALGWYYRGRDVAAKTGAARFGKLDEHLRSASSHIERALAIEPRLVVARQLQIFIAMSVGPSEGRAKALAAALATCPECFRVRSKYMVSLLPRWGGSFAQMERFAVESQAAKGKNPRLAALLGYADYARCMDYREASKLTAALEACDRAISAGDTVFFHKERAWVLEKLERSTDALAAVERAAELEPQSDDVLALRARLRMETGAFEEGTTDLRTLALLDPVSEDTRYAIDRGVKSLVVAGYRRTQRGELEGALAAFDLALTLSPGNEEALKYREQAVAAGKLSPEAERLEALAASNPTDFDVYKRLDDELIKTRRFDRIVQHWTRYLSRVPDDARAYDERGGANLHAGNLDDAVADYQKACSAGNQSGCAGLEVARARQR